MSARAAWNRLELVGLVGVLLLAAFLRLYDPTVVEFKRDEANLSQLGWDMARGRAFYLLGIDSSVGIRNPPISVYITAIPYLFTSDPTWTTAFVALLNVIAVGLLYGMTRRYYGVTAAFICAGLFAATPWAVIFSRKIWAQDMLAPFIVLTVWTAILGFLEGKRWAQVWHLPLLAFTAQIHYGVFVLAPITVVLFGVAIGRRNLTRWFYLSLIGVAIVFLPYAIGLAQAASTGTLGLENSTLFRARPADSTDVPKDRFTIEPLQLALIVGSGMQSHALIGAEGLAAFKASTTDFEPLFTGVSYALIGTAAYLLTRLVVHRTKRTVIDLVVLLWVLINPLAYVITWTPVYSHYLIPMIPAAALLSGIVLSDLIAAFGRTRLVQIAVIAAVIGLISVYSLQFLSVLNFVNTTYAPAFNTPLGWLLPVRTAVLDQQPDRVVALLDGTYIGYHEKTTIWDFLLTDVAVRRYEDDRTRVYPSTAALYLQYIPDCTTVQTDPARTYPIQNTDGCYTITDQRPALDLTEFIAIDESDQVTFADGARLTAYRWQPDTGCVTTAWQLESGARTEDFSTSVKFIAASGEQLADGDALFYQGKYWLPGDRITRQFCMNRASDRAAEVTRIAVGLYTMQLEDGLTRFYNASAIRESIPLDPPVQSLNVP